MILQLNETAFIEMEERFQAKKAKYSPDALDETLIDMLYQESLLEAAAACNINSI